MLVPTTGGTVPATTTTVDAAGQACPVRARDVFLHIVTATVSASDGLEPRPLPLSLTVARRLPRSGTRTPPVAPHPVIKAA